MKFRGKDDDAERKYYKTKKLTEDFTEFVKEKEKLIIRNNLIACSECKQKNKLQNWKLVQLKSFSVISIGSPYHILPIENSNIVCPDCKSELFINRHAQKEEILYPFTKKIFFEKEIF